MTTNKDSNKKNELSRRKFLGTVGAASAFTIIPRHVMGGKGYTAASDMVNLAGVGVGGRGVSVGIGVAVGTAFFVS